MTSNNTRAARLAQAYIEAFERSEVFFTFPSTRPMFHAACDEMRVIEDALLAEGFTFAEGVRDFVMVPADEERVNYMRAKLLTFEGSSWEERARARLVWRDTHDEGEWSYLIASAEAEFCGGFY